MLDDILSERDRKADFAYSAWKKQESYSKHNIFTSYKKEIMI